jgi:photosystem II stability/assembly factor-like uncharacterized protein
MFFVDAQRGWFAANTGIIARTLDGGATWMFQSNGLSVNIADVWFVNATTGWAVGQAGTILKTVTGGE